MRRQGAIPMLAARCYAGRLLGVLVLLGALEAGIFYGMLRGDLSQLMENLFDSRLYRLAAAWGLAAVTAVLCWGGGSGGGPARLIRRLPVERWQILTWWLLCCGAGYLIFWAFQLAVALGLGALHLRLAGDAVPGQTLFLAFYRSAQLHSLFPGADGGRWFGTAALYLGLSLNAAGSAAAAWEGRWKRSAVVLSLATYLSDGAVGSNGWSILLGLVSLAAGGLTLAGVWEEERL